MPVVRDKTTDDIMAENERLRSALDSIIGVALGCRDRDFPAAKVHKIAMDALGDEQK